MASTAALRQQALWAYEFARLRRAARITFVIVLLVTVAMWETGRASPAVSLGVTLAMTSILLRWWHRRRSDDVTVGLWAGVIPLGVSLIVCHIGVSCSSTASLVLCGSAGVVAGVALAHHAGHDQAGMLPRWIASAAVAGLTSTLGCGALNSGAVVGILVGICSAGILSGVVRIVRRPLWRSK